MSNPGPCILTGDEEHEFWGIKQQDYVRIYLDRMSRIADDLLENLQDEQDMYTTAMKQQEYLGSIMRKLELNITWILRLCQPYSICTILQGADPPPKFTDLKSHI